MYMDISDLLKRQEFNASPAASTTNETMFETGKEIPVETRMAGKGG